MEFVKYIFGNFWHFLLFVVAIAVVLDGIADIVRAFNKNQPKNTDKDD